MEANFDIPFTKADRKKNFFLRRISTTLTYVLLAHAVLCGPAPSWALDPNDLASAGQPERVLGGLESHLAPIWGRIDPLAFGSNGLIPYEPLETGSLGEVEQRLMTAEARPAFKAIYYCDIVLTHHCRELLPLPPEGNDRLSIKREPREREGQDNDHLVATLSLREKFRVYLVRRGDSLWNIANKFDMHYRTLAEINGLKDGAILQVGRPLKVKVVSSRELRLNLSARSLADHPALLEQIRMIDGRPVPRWLVTDFVADVIDHRSPWKGKGDSNGGAPNLTIVINFRLVKTLLEGRARQYQSVVLAHAEKFDLDPALIMAMIHTESAFDPKARSNASAYGLMQLVPHTAGQEAYYRVYGQRRKLTPQYLYDPDNNIELGTAYLHTLINRYLGAIADPISRIYCAVAAYHAGPSNVGKAFIPEASIQRAAPVINQLSPADVYKRLVEALPAVESRNYVRDVIKRIRHYSGWYSDNGGTQI